ncbi:TRAP transporter substrate-binding protein DctP [Hafnia alvei]|uniref:TRAP transporter substrate-binding protein DctP n=1 Tax=Hafnia alvei TaxID=569 RepID=UPI00345DF0C2
MELAKKLLAVVLAGALLPSTAFAVKILKYSDHEALGGTRTEFINDVFFSAIEKESHGRLKIEPHWGGELAAGYGALALVGQGKRADMAIVVPEYTAKQLPLHQIFKSFPVGPSADRQVSFFRHIYAEVPAFPAELEQNNVVNLYFATGYPVAFFSTHPLTSLTEVKGETWRLASFWHQAFLTHAGAKAVTLPWGDETRNALRSGALDGIMVNVDSGYEIDAHITAPNILIAKNLWLGHIYLLVINKDTWNELEKQDQDAIQRAAEIAYKKQGSVMNKAFDTQIAEMRKTGANVSILQAKELQQWKTLSRYQDVQESWVKEQEKSGVQNAGATLQKMTQMVNQALR